MKKFSTCFIIICIVILNFQVAAIAENTLFPYEQTFQNAIGVNDISDIKSGVVVNNTEKSCADIDYEDLKDWLSVYCNFEYDRVIALLEAYDLSGNYIKLWNEDKSQSYTVYPNGGVIVGKYGEPYESHRGTKQNYIWYLPIIGNSRSVLNTADLKLSRIYFDESYEGYKDREREFTKNDEAEFPAVNLLITNNASEWAKPEIEKAAACNLMVYNLSDKYTQPISRYEFCQLVYRLIATEFKPNADSRIGIEFAMQDVVTERGIVGVYNSKFTDCYYTEVEVLASMGIIQGMGDGTFVPDEYITREQAAVLLYRTAEFLGNKTLIKPNYDKKYDDENMISDWAMSSVLSMKAMGIMQGTSENEFSPKDTYTAEQAIATVLRLYECK